MISKAMKIAVDLRSNNTRGDWKRGGTFFLRLGNFQFYYNNEGASGKVHEDNPPVKAVVLIIKKQCQCHKIIG